MSNQGMSINLRSFDLGSPAAERDKGLRDYFVESDTFRRMSDGPKRIIVGNRGAGKSALFKYMAERARESRNTSVIELYPEDYSYELLSETMMQESDGAWHKQSAYTAAWKYLLYVLVMKDIAQGGYSRARSESLKKIQRYVRDNHSGAQPDKMSALISYLKRLEGVKVGKYEASIKTRQLQQLYKLEEISDLMPALRDVLEDQQVYIFVDELDKGWDESEDAKAFVAGLFQACQDMNNVSDNMRLYMSLRQELYENIPAIYDDAQKVRDITETVTWDDAGLCRLMARRIEHALRRVADSGVIEGVDSWEEREFWETLFVATLAYRQNKSFNYLVDRTLYRPREMIQFCNLIIERAATEREEVPLDYTTIVRAEYDYSEGRAKDIAAEYKFQYPSLVKVFEEFRGYTYTFDREELEELCVKVILRERPSSDDLGWLDGYGPEELIEVLWRVGFLKAQAVGGIKGGVRSGSTYLGPISQAV